MGKDQDYMLENDMTDEDIESFEDGDELEDNLEEGEEESAVAPAVYMTQEEVDRAIQNRLARDRKTRERELAAKLGVSVDEAAEYIEAGRSVSQASGLTPAQIRQRIADQGGSQVNQPVTQTDDSVKREIAEIKELISEERIEKVRSLQEAEARKEFGTLYDKHREDILDKAEELGLSIPDATAIVIRPKLREHVEETTRAKQQFKRNRRVEGSGEGPVKEVDIAAALTPKEKRTAMKMGISLKDYYTQKKELGEIE